LKRKQKKHQKNSKTTENFGNYNQTFRRHVSLGKKTLRNQSHSCGMQPNIYGGIPTACRICRWRFFLPRDNP